MLSVCADAPGRPREPAPSAAMRNVCSPSYANRTGPQNQEPPIRVGHDWRHDCLISGERENMRHLSALRRKRGTFLAIKQSPLAGANLAGRLVLTSRFHAAARVPIRWSAEAGSLKQCKLGWMPPCAGPWRSVPWSRVAPGAVATTAPVVPWPMTSAVWALASRVEMNRGLRGRTGTQSAREPGATRYLTRPDGGGAGTLHSPR